ncbi:hypothetical protein JQN72_05365 [Phycicoccus sp. CSK15P-2]|uniref:DUF6318 family protein n=1 Tax=Phycicoccus sp. CSK15P-2 TaxID=2807627 RepID=UPI00194F2161|nr:DUF6318 family protein [Phycicoccus sp. CSK15P-2]MBM6403670.1 hypothetical protein [Phycicoccus sp. CSK15P-2]
MPLSGRVWMVGAAVVAVVVAGGCTGSDGAEPSGSPDASSNASGSPSPTSTPSPSESASDGPGVPVAARERTPEGAEAFVEFFFEQFNVAWTEPRPGLIESLSDPECQFCKKAEQVASDLDSRSERYQTDAVQVGTAKPFGGAPERQQFLEIEFKQLSSKIVDEAGAVVRTSDAKVNPAYLTVEWESGAWRVLELERTQ